MSINVREAPASPKLVEERLGAAGSSKMLCNLHQLYLFCCWTEMLQLLCITRNFFFIDSLFNIKYQCTCGQFLSLFHASVAALLCSSRHPLFSFVRSRGRLREVGCFHVQCDQMICVSGSGRDWVCGKYVDCAFCCFQTANPHVWICCASTVTLAVFVVMFC